MSNTIINLVHANGFPAGSYRTFLSYFQSEYQCVAHQQYGHNPHFPIHNNWRYLVDELIDFVKQQPEPVINIGHSFGGVITFMAACQAPELFRGIILLDPPIFTGISSFTLRLAKKTRLIDKVSPAAKAKIRRTHWPLNTDLSKNFSRSQLFKNFDARCLQDYVDSAVKEHKGQLELCFSRDVETEIFRNLPTNLSTFKRKLTVPSALIYGEKTDVSTPKLVQRFNKQHPEMTIHSIKNGGHMFPLEQPQATAELIQDIIKYW